MRRSWLVFAAVLAAAPAARAQEAGSTLYARLGGYDVVASVVDEFLRRFDADSALAPYLGGINAASGARIRQHFVDLICARTGGPCLYTGREMAETHTGLGIPPSHFDRVIEHMKAALHERGVGRAPAGELLALLGRMRGDVVER